MGQLLTLKDVIDDIVQSHGDATLSVESMPVAVTSPPVEVAHAVTAKALSTDTARVATVVGANPHLAAETTNAATLSNTSVLPDNVQQMLLNYEDLSKKILQFVNVPTSQVTAQHALAQPTLTEPTSLNSVALHRSTGPKAVPHHTTEPGVPLSYIQRREFKVQGGQIGDHSSDIYNSVCRQIEEGVKDNFTDSEIVRGVLRIIKPGDFKDMLVNKEGISAVTLRGEK